MIDPTDPTIQNNERDPLIPTENKRCCTPEKIRRIFEVLGEINLRHEGCWGKTYTFTTLASCGGIVITTIITPFISSYCNKYCIMGLYLSSLTPSVLFGLYTGITYGIFRKCCGRDESEIDQIEVLIEDSGE